MALSTMRGQDVVSQIEKYKDHFDQAVDRQQQEDLRQRARAGEEPVQRHEDSVRGEAKKITVNAKSQLVHQNIRLCCGHVRTCAERNTEVIEVTGIIAKEILYAPGKYTLGGVSSQLFKLIYKFSEIDILTVPELRDQLTATDGDQAAWEKLLDNQHGRLLLTISLHYGLKVVRVETLPTLATAAAPQEYKDFYNTSTGLTVVCAHNGHADYKRLRPEKNGKLLGNNPLTLVNYETGEEATYKSSAAAYVIHQHQNEIEVVDGRGVSTNAVSLQAVLPAVASSTSSNGSEDQGQLSTVEKNYASLCAGAAYERHLQVEAPQPPVPHPAVPATLQRLDSAASAAGSEDSFSTFASADLAQLPVSLENTYLYVGEPDKENTLGSFTEDIDGLAGAQGAPSPLSEHSATPVGLELDDDTDIYHIGKAYLEGHDGLAIPAVPEKHVPIHGAVAAGHQFEPEGIHARDQVVTKCGVQTTRRKPENGTALTTFTAPHGNRFVVKNKADSNADWTATVSQSLLGKDFIVTQDKIAPSFKAFFETLGDVVCVDSVAKPKRDVAKTNFKGYAKQVGILKTWPRTDKDRNRVKHCIIHFVSEVYAAVEEGLKPYFDTHRKLSYGVLQRSTGVPRVTAEDNHLGSAPPAKRAKAAVSIVEGDTDSD